MRLSSKPCLWIIIFFMTALAIFFRFYNIGKMVYWLDEAYTSVWISGYKWDEVKQIISDREIKVEDVLKFQEITRERGIFDTVEALAACDPHHPPLYYVMLRMWMNIFGDSVEAVRSLSAVLNLMALPFLFWLCLRLFESKKVAWIAVLLVMFSPFHVLYSREAREYSLWILTSLISSAALIHALMARSWLSWFFYAVSIVCGLYSHELFASMLLVHWLYVFSFQYVGTGRKFIPFIQEYKLFWISSFTGVAVFIPWLYNNLINTSKISKLLSWATEPLDIKSLIAMWGYNYSVIFFDFNKSRQFVDRFTLSVLGVYFFQFIILCLGTYAVVYLFLRAGKRGSLIIYLIFIHFLFLVVPDLIFGMWSSGVTRYLCPSLLGLQIAVAYLLGGKIKSVQKKIWKTATLIIIGCGILSSTLIIRSESWWTKPSDFYTPGLARIINQSTSALVITPFSGKLFSLSRRLNPEIRILALEETSSVNIFNNYNDIYVYKPTDWLLKKIEKKFGNMLYPVDQRGDLWIMNCYNGSR